MITSVKNAVVALCVLCLSEVLIPSSSPSSLHQLDLQILHSIQLLITPHTIFLLNKSDLVTYILPRTLSTASSYFVSPHPNAPSHQVYEGYSITHLKLVSSDTFGLSQAWSTSLVTNQPEGPHEFVCDPFPLLLSFKVVLLILISIFKSAFSFSFTKP